MENKEVNSALLRLYGMANYDGCFSDLTEVSNYITKLESITNKLDVETKEVK